jgi:ABC-type arginine/histidine transport system permease subunit
MVPLRAFRKTMTVLAAAFGCAIVASMLPGNAYQRWQLLAGAIQA